jgi:hypothetical protein
LGLTGSVKKTTGALIATNPDDFWDGNLLEPVNHTEIPLKGQVGVATWTGTAPSGVKSAGPAGSGFCNDWTSASNSLSTQIGDSHQKDGRWLAGTPNAITCAYTSLRHYCISTLPPSTPTPTPTPQPIPITAAQLCSPLTQSLTLVNGVTSAAALTSSIGSSAGWSAPAGTPASGTGATFAPAFASAGTHTVTVRNTTKPSFGFINVNGDNEVSTVDAQAVIDFLNATAPTPQPGNGGPLQNQANRFDVNGDGQVSTIDSVLVINFLNTPGQSSIPSNQSSCSVTVTGGGSNPTPTAIAAPSTAPGLSAQFVVPIDNEVVTLGEALDVRVKLTETDASKVVCQEWLLDGVPIANAQWEGGQSPDLSATPCQ